MVQWVNRLRNNIFINLPPLPLLCQISGVLHLAQPGHMAGWLAGWQADKIQVNFKIFKIWHSSLSTIVLDSRNWSEIVRLPKISRFKNQPCNRLYSKKPTGMHCLGYYDAVSWLNKAKTQIFQPTGASTKLGQIDCKLCR